MVDDNQMLGSAIASKSYSFLTSSVIMYGAQRERRQINGFHRVTDEMSPDHSIYSKRLENLRTWPEFL